MSTVLILTPVIISNLPAIAAAVAGAAAAMGLVAKESVKGQVQQAQQQLAEVEQAVSVELADSEVLAQGVETGREFVLTKGEVELRVSRDEQMTQCFVYNRVASELKNKGFQIVNEEVMEDESVRINVRRWVD